MFGCCFIDMDKGYDKVNGEKLFEVMERLWSARNFGGCDRKEILMMEAW